MNNFIKLTSVDEGAPVFIRKDLIGGITVNGKTTIVGVTADDMDYAVKETPEQILKMLEGKKPHFHFTQTKENNNEKTSITGDDRDDQSDRECGQTPGRNNGRKGVARSRW